MCDASTLSLFKNFLLAGTEQNKLSTTISVPEAIPLSLTLSTIAERTLTCVPKA
jgi:hypothetical protein